MTPELQRQLSQVRTGDHLCYIYDSPDEMLPAAAHFLKEGLARGEHGLYVVDDSDLPAVTRAFTAAGIDVTREVERGALRFLDAREYCPLETFEPEAMLARFRALGDDMARAGIPGARAAVEMTWALTVGAPLDLLAEYECWGNQIFEHFTGVSLCMYNRRRFPAAAMERLLRAHPIVVMGQEVAPNPFYEPPEVHFAAEPETRRFEWMLERLHRARQDRLEREALTLSEVEARRRAASAERSEFLVRAARVLSSTLDPNQIAHAQERLLAERAEWADDLLQQELDAIARLALENAQLYQTALAARDEAERANRAKVGFLSAVSHELRTPLNAISGYADLLDMGIAGDLDLEQRRMIARIKHSQEHLTRLIDDILDFARIEAGRIDFERALVDLDPLLRDVGSMLELIIEDRGIRYAYSVVDPSITAFCDADRVRQIVLNLLGNALKFTSQGGRVEIHVDADEDHALVFVRDSGRGISADAADTIFEPFVQHGRDSQDSSRQGVGLGLTISRELARAMGGDITVNSRVGVGSTFTLRLPRRAPEPITPAQTVA